MLPLNIGDTVTWDALNSWSGYTPDLIHTWSARGEGSSSARIISLTLYHIPLDGYTGVNSGAVSWRAEVIFPNGQTMHNLPVTPFMYDWWMENR